MDSLTLQSRHVISRAASDLRSLTLSYGWETLNVAAQVIALMRDVLCVWDGTTLARSPLLYVMLVCFTAFSATFVALLLKLTICWQCLRCSDFHLLGRPFQTISLCRVTLLQVCRLSCVLCYRCCTCLQRYRLHPRAGHYSAHSCSGHRS